LQVSKQPSLVLNKLTENILPVVAMLQPHLLASHTWWANLLYEGYSRDTEDKRPRFIVHIGWQTCHTYPQTDTCHSFVAGAQSKL